MNSLHQNLCFAIILTFVVSVSGQEKGLKSISTASLKTHLEFFASDSLQGRTFGTKTNGLDIAADYLVRCAKEVGLKPGLPGFLQPVPIVYSTPDPSKTRLVIKNTAQNIVFETDSLVGLFRSRETETFSGEIVFAGFGWVDSISGYNDFKGMDIKGKIVVCSVGSPQSFLEDAKGKTPGFENLLEQAKLNRVLKMGAKGLILMTSPFDKNSETFNSMKARFGQENYSLKNNNLMSATNKLVLTKPVLFDVLSGKPGSLEQALNDRVKKLNPLPEVPVGFFADITVGLQITELKGENVIGVVEGSDPKRKDECFVYVAHYDHLGISNDGDVYNGADDNGSGDVALLEIAKAYMSLDVKPRRSIVFLWVTGEEIGMLGSQYYTAHPLFSPEKTVACINLDMVGRVFEPRDTVWKSSPKMVKDFNGLYELSGNNCPGLVKINDKVCKKLGLIPDKSLPSSFLRSSDHYSFYSKGIPILNLATGWHADYHKPSDEVSKINFEKMKRMVELSFIVGYEVANRKERLKKKN